MTDDQMDKFLAEAEAKIAEYGVIIIGVIDGQQFYYTVGLTAIGEPELMLMGNIPHEYARATLNDLASRVVDDGVRFKPGDVPPDVLDGYDVMLCGPVPALMLDKYPPGLAGRIYGVDAVRAYQVVYQDKNHLYPWQEGYDMPGQPYLMGGRG